MKSEKLSVEKLMDIKIIQNVAICAIVAFGLSRVVVKFIDTVQSGHLINATNSVVLNSGRDINITDDWYERMFEK